MLYKLLPKQQEFINVPHNNKLDVAILHGGYGCVDGDTELDTLFGKCKIKDFEGGFIWSFFNGHKVLLFATKPKQYGKKKLYEVKTKSGLRIVCTKEHKFLTPDGFKPLSELSTNTLIFCHSLSSSQNLPQTNSELCPSKFPLNGLRLMKKFQDFLLSCLNGCHLYDVLSHLTRDNYLLSILFLLMISLVQLILLSVQELCNLFGISSNKPSFKDTIDSVTYSKEDLYYDLHVPLTNCYTSQGFINHNSGKTFCGSLLGLMLARKYPGSVGLVGAKEYELLKNTTMVSYFEHLENFGYVKDYNFTYNKIDKKITLSNGSVILFKGIEDSEKFKSLNLHWAEIEECSQVPDKSFIDLLGRLRGTIKPSWDSNFKYRLFGHTNPQPNKGWIWKRFIENPKENYRLIIAPTSSNTHLPEHFVESLKNEYDAEYYRINVLGEFGNYASGLIVKNFTDDNVKELQYNKDLPLHITCDFNVNPMCWCLAHKDDDNVYFFDELVLENTTTQQAIDELIRRYPDHRGEIIVNGDASGDNRTTTSEYTNYMIIKRALELHGYNPKFKLRSFNPPIMNRIQAFNARVCNSNYERHLFVDKKCKWLLHNVYNLSFKEGTSIVDVPTLKQIKNDRTLKFLTHPFDAASYLVEYYFPIK